MKKIICLLLAFVTVFGLSACGNDPDYETEVEKEYTYKEHEEMTDYVLMRVDGFGEIIIELYPETAPITVANFKKLVSNDFYDGLTIHRISKNFVIQGGAPNGDGTGGSSETIKGEFSSNGVANNLKHERGVISMARSKAPDSASSQFFICLDDENVAQLDGSYAAFGRVISGMKIVDDIADVEVYGEMPMEIIEITEMIFVTVTEK